MMSTHMSASFVPKRVTWQNHRDFSQPQFKNNASSAKAKPAEDVKKSPVHVSDRLTQIETTLAQVLEQVKTMNHRLLYINAVRNGVRDENIEYL